MEELLLFCPRMSDIEALNAIGVIELSDGSIVKIMSSTLPTLLEFSLTSGVSSAFSTASASASAPMNLAYPNEKSALLLHIETRNATTATTASASASDLYQLQEDEHMEECLNGRGEHSANQEHMALDEYYASASEEHYSQQAHAQNMMNMNNMNMSNMSMSNMNMSNLNMSNLNMDLNMNMNMNDSLRMTVSTCSTDARLRTMDFGNNTVFPAMDRDMGRDRDMGMDMGRDMDSMNRNIQGHDIRTTHVLKIESYVIANHFKSLIRWTAELDLVSSPNENVFPFVLNIGDDIRQAFTLQTDIGLSTLSWGGDNNNNNTDQGLNPCDNNQDNNQDVNLLDQDHGMSAITLLIDTRLKSYTLTVCAPCAFELEFRVAGCVELVKILGEMSHRMTLTGKAF